LLAQIQQLEQERSRASNQVVALSEENARLKSGRSKTELLRLRRDVGTLRKRATSNQTTATPPSFGLAKMMNDPAMREYMLKAMREKMKSMYADLIKELKHHSRWGEMSLVETEGWEPLN
jgi:hypothetical protein